MFKELRPSNFKTMEIEPCSLWDSFRWMIYGVKFTLIWKTNYVQTHWNPTPLSLYNTNGKELILIIFVLNSEHQSRWIYKSFGIKKALFKKLEMIFIPLTLVWPLSSSPAHSLASLRNPECLSAPWKTRKS